MSLFAAAVRRTARLFDPDAVPSYAQEGEDLVLRRFLEGHTTGFYVDVGAHHPTRFSNTAYYYARGWRGMNIEPAAEAISLFLRTRKRDINLQLGVSDRPGELTYYLFDEPALNTFDETLKRQRESATPYRSIGSMQVRVERLERIFADHLPARQAIDFMSVDVEGFDLPALRSNDWDIYRPRFVLAEALDFALERASEHPLHRYMVAVGYELVAKTRNTIFYRDRR